MIFMTVLSEGSTKVSPALTVKVQSVVGVFTIMDWQSLIMR